MKKIISLFSALALVATSVVAMTAGVSAAEKPATLRYDVVYDNEAAPYAAGSKGSINFYCDNLELISMDDMDTYFSVINTVGITAKLDETYIKSKKLSLSSPALSSSTKNYTAGECVLQWGTADFDSMVSNMDKALFTIKFEIVKELTAPVKVELTGCNIKVQSFNEDGEKVETGTVYYGQEGMGLDEVLVVPELTVGPAAAQRPESCIEKTSAFTFDGLKAPYVKITNGSKSNNYFLPAGVVGTTETYGILKYNTADVTKGSEFVLELWDTGAAAMTKAIGTIVAE